MQSIRTRPEYLSNSTKHARASELLVVLMESTVGEVLPAVRQEISLLDKASQELASKLNQTETQMLEFKKKHDIRIVSEEFADE